MFNNKFAALKIVFGLVILFMTDGLFILDQRTQAIVLKFGEFQRIYEKPGLKFKIPLLEDVLFYETRILDYDLQPIYVTTQDQKRLIVDTYTRYKIGDPLKFFQSVKPADEIGARLRLDAIISGSVRNIMGKVALKDMLTHQRSVIMKNILNEVKQLAEPLGIEIIDVRIIKTELPFENRNAVFARMNSELVRFAKENRAKGEEVSLSIKAQADKERTIILAQANSDAEKLIGEGEADAINIAGKAFNVNYKFYEFYKTLETYKKSIGNGTNYVFSTKNELFKFLTNSLLNQ